MKKYIDTIAAICTAGISLFFSRGLIVIWECIPFIRCSSEEINSGKILAAATGVYFVLQVITCGICILGVLKASQRMKKIATCLAVVLILFYFPLAFSILSTLMHWML